MATSSVQAPRKLSFGSLLLWGYLAILLLTVTVAVTPVVHDLFLRSFVISLSDLPFAALVLAACLEARGRSVDAGERASWGLLAIAFGFMMPLHLFAIVEPDYPGIRFDLIQEICLCGYYLLVSLALELRLSGSSMAAYREVRKVRMAGTAVFVFGLFVYFVAIPGILEREIYDSWVPSFFLYIVLDVHIVVRLAGLVGMGRKGGWRTTYTFLLAGFSASLMLDFAELSHYAGLLNLPFGGPWELLWCLPYLPLLLATRTQRPEVEAPPPELSRDSRIARIPFLITQPLFYAVLVPLLHFGSYALHWSALELRSDREILLLVMLPVLAGLSFLHHRALEKENEHLERERDEVALRIQRSQRMESIGRLAGGIAHDFNNLLQVIHGSNEVLRARIPSDSPEQRHLADIQESVDRAARLTDQLLAVGRRKRMDPRPMDLNKVVLRMVGIIDRVIGDQVRVEVSTNPDAGNICVDRSQIDQALLNLAINARDSMSAGGTLTIETDVLCGEENQESLGGETFPPASDSSAQSDGPSDSGPRWAIVSVSDTGCGMDEDVLSKVFEPFFTTKAEGKGTGLGLSMVYGFVTQSGGRVEVVSEPGVGTRIALMLPRFDPPVSDPPTSEAPHPTPPEGSPRAPRLDSGGVDGKTADGRTILLVEDEDDVRSVIRELLSGRGFHVLEAPDGAAALNLLGSDEQPDLLLTDVLMPGIPVAQLVSLALDAAPNMKVLFMTGHAGSRLSSPDLRNIPILEKPFTRRSLTKKIEEVLGHK